MKSLTIAVACHSLVFAGGIIRFIRLGREIKKNGHNLSFILFSSEFDAGLIIEDEFDVFDFNQAQDLIWDITMVPGAGFPDETIQQFARLKTPQFGIRVQHILNDPTKYNQFSKVNQYFKPHIVVFNNRDWQPGGFTALQANSFRYLEGAVSMPIVSRKKPERDELIKKFIVGGLANKNPKPLLEAARLFDGPICVRLFGKTGNLANEYADLLHNQRLVLLGNIPYDDLENYYADLDCVVHTENFAGWANLAAEALAYRVPLICTPHGTLSFALDKVSALVMTEPTTENILSRLQLIYQNCNDFIDEMVNNGSILISRFSWRTYADSLLNYARSGLEKYYTYAPEYNLYGKWPVQSRIKGLSALFRLSSNLTVLDLGASECVIAKKFLDAGAFCAHCYDINPHYIKNGCKLIRDYQTSYAIQASLSPWSEFQAKYRPILLAMYDIVLFLGVYHHLPVSTRREILIGALEMVRQYFVIRTPRLVFVKENLHTLIEGLGFVLFVECEEDASIGMGGLCIYKRLPSEQLQ